MKHDIYNKVWGKVSHHITLMLRRPRRGDGAAERGCGEGRQAAGGVGCANADSSLEPTPSRVFPGQERRAGEEGRSLRVLAWPGGVTRLWEPPCLALLCFPMGGNELRVSPVTLNSAPL